MKSSKIKNHLKKIKKTFVPKFTLIKFSKKLSNKKKKNKKLKKKIIKKKNKKISIL